MTLDRSYSSLKLQEILSVGDRGVTFNLGRRRLHEALPAAARVLRCPTGAAIARMATRT